MVAMDESERVPIGHEPGKRVEHVAMALDDQRQLDANVVDCVAEAVLTLLVVALGRQVRPLGAHRHPDEVDEVAGHDEVPVVGRGHDRPSARGASERGSASCQVSPDPSRNGPSRRGIAELRICRRRRWPWIGSIRRGSTSCAVKTSNRRSLSSMTPR